MDFHTPHEHGDTFPLNGKNTDVQQLLPTPMLVIDIKPDELGTEEFHCPVSDRVKAGRTALFTVQRQRVI